LIQFLILKASDILFDRRETTLVTDIGARGS